MRKKKLLEDLYGPDVYNDFQANRLDETMFAMESIDRRHLRGVKALRFRYSGNFHNPNLTWKRVGELIGHFRTGEPISQERARQMACCAMRWLQHPQRKKFILKGEDWQ